MRYDVTGFEHYTDNEMGGIFLNGDYFEIASNPTMQFTGILDKNGKEIYEGDILSFIDKTDYGLPYIGKVVFDNGTFLIETWYSKFRNWTNMVFLEITGNVHENPNLL